MTEYNTENKSSGSKIAMIAIAAVLILGVGAAALYLTDVDQTQEARLPDVNVEVEEGQMPKFDVDVADVKVGTENVDVKVPAVGVETKTIEDEVPVDVEAGMKDETLEVPTIDIERPEEDDPADSPTQQMFTIT